MSFKELRQGVYEIPIGPVNTFLLESTEGLVVIDTGIKGGADKILAAVAELGKKPTDIHHILLTHWHPDHISGLAALKRATNAQTYAHPLDAPLIAKGGDLDPRSPSSPRPFWPAPGLLTHILFRLFIKPYLGVEGTPIDHEINEGDSLPFLPDLKIIFAPGHSDGQLVFLLERDGGLLFAADACANMPSLNWSLGYENLADGKSTLKKLCNYHFQGVAFGHGKAILQNADTKWRNKWANLAV